MEESANRIQNTLCSIPGPDATCWLRLGFLTLFPRRLHPQSCMLILRAIFGMIYTKDSHSPMDHGSFIPERTLSLSLKNLHQSTPISQNSSPIGTNYSLCLLDAYTCGSECRTTKSIIARQEREFVLQFLMGLNDRFTHIRGQILLSNPLPAVNKVFSLVIQEEAQLGVNPSLIAEPAAMVLKSKNLCALGGNKPIPKPVYSLQED